MTDEALLLRRHKNQRPLRQLDCARELEDTRLGPGIVPTKPEGKNQSQYGDAAASCQAKCERVAPLLPKLTLWFSIRVQWKRYQHWRTECH